MPCPGPQVRLLMVTLLTPWTIETQSSPTPIVDEVIVMLEERLMWIPSVFGLSAGALMFMFDKFMLSHLESSRWKDLLFNKFMLLTVPCETPKNLRLCKNYLYSMKICIINICWEHETHKLELIIWWKNEVWSWQ